MSLSLILACLWAIAATLVAFLPMRLQFAPGLLLLVLSIPLIIYLGVEHGVWVSLIGFLALLSLFRRPLSYFARKALRRQKGEGG